MKLAIFYGDSVCFWRRGCIADEPAGRRISYNDLMTYVQTCQGRGVAQKTIAHYIADLRKLFDFLVSEE